MMIDPDPYTLFWGAVMFTAWVTLMTAGIVLGFTVSAWFFLLSVFAFALIPWGAPDKQP